MKSLAAGLGLAALALAGPLLFYRWAGGSFLPTTFAAKGGSQPHWLSPNLQYLHTVLGIFFEPQPWMTLAAGGGALRPAGRPAASGTGGSSRPLARRALLAYSFLTPARPAWWELLAPFPLPVLIVLECFQPAGRARKAPGAPRPARVALAAAEPLSC